MFEALTSISAFELPPGGTGTARALSRIGYELQDALADIIDNSIDADASRVEITFFRTDSKVIAVTIADNGRGMNEVELRQGMRFAGRADYDDGDLGTFGMGMKSASLSQCGSLTVISRQGGETVACRWSVESIGKDWRCEVLDRPAAERVFPTGYSPKHAPQSSGTLVIWERLDRMATGTSEGDLDEFLNRLLSKLELHLGLVFHRFLERSSISIILTARNESSAFGLPRTVRAYNPFGYASSGKANYPKIFTTTLPGAGELELTAHIWPADSVDPAFLLGRRTGTPHQGFYFYRNDRLIQAGGWNGVVPQETEAELSPARVSVDLPARGTVVNIQKSAIQVTAALSLALEKARCGRQKLSDYLEDARRLYRAERRRERPAAELPTVLGGGVSVGLRRAVRRLICEDALAREIAFSWEPLPREQVFDIDPIGDRIFLNKKYRREILGEGSASRADAQVVKTLIFLLVRDHFDHMRVSRQRREWLETCNAVLLEAVKSL
jgi:hypothetical protein